MDNLPTYSPTLTMGSTMPQGVTNADRVFYRWLEMDITWANATFTWDEIRLQKAPIGTVITNLQI
jgi:hypothetical protein